MNIVYLWRKALINLNYLLVLLGIVLVTACSNKPKTDNILDATSNQDKPKQIRAVPIHLVQPGETLFAIARKHNISWQEIASTNNITEPHTIYPGQTLQITKNKKPQVKISNSSKSTPKNIENTKTTKKQTANNDVVTEFKGTFSSNTSCAGKWVWPAQGTVVKLNKGIDIVGTLGSEVVAAADGLVAYIGTGITGYGLSLVIKHNDSCVSVYAHNNKALVAERTVVKAGQVIAQMGNSSTDRVKLHFEIMQQEKSINPILYLPKR